MEKEQLIQKSYNIIGKENFLTGQFKLSGFTRIACQIDGKLEHRPSKEEHTHLILERESKVKGEIFCEDLEIFGEVDGKIQSKGKVVIHSSAIVKGEVSCKNLVIYPGSHTEIQGKTENYY